MFNFDSFIIIIHLFVFYILENLDNGMYTEIYFFIFEYAIALL